MSRERERKAGERGAEDFASRWSRMKRGAKDDSGAPAADPKAATPPAESRDARSDEEILRELGLPDPESLKPGDDIRGFMAGGVPARIRNRVLRRLWVSNPALANLDGLVDYGEDFTDAAMVPAVLQTAYKVGRGWARDAVEDEPASSPAGKAAEDTTADAGAERGGETRGSEDESQATPSPAASAGEVAEDAAGAESAAEAEGAADSEAEPCGTPRESAFVARGAAPRPAPRRMRFRFSGD